MNKDLNDMCELHNKLLNLALDAEKLASDMRKLSRKWSAKIHQQVENEKDHE